jgi:hypothetical protein
MRSTRARLSQASPSAEGTANEVEGRSGYGLVLLSQKCSGGLRYGQLDRRQRAEAVPLFGTRVRLGLVRLDMGFIAKSGFRPRLVLACLATYTQAPGDRLKASRDVCPQRPGGLSRMLVIGALLSRGGPGMPHRA